jgi:CubicO group peptidase (beta-lactamase class C family)
MLEARGLRWFFGGLALLVVGCASSGSGAPENEWPTSEPEARGFDSAGLAKVVERIDEEELPIDSIQIVRNGELILDAYFYPYLGEQPHDIASVTKSVTSTLVGIAVEQGLLDLDQAVTAFFGDLAPPPAGDGKDDIEVSHLLTMSSGLACGYLPGEQELYAMIASDHYVKHALELPMTTAPGATFAYCSPGSHLLSAMVGAASGVSTHDFATEHLFEPLGISESVWPDDPQGVNHGWGDLQLHPHDMARIGQLFLNRGEWNGRRVVSSEWVDVATRRHISASADGTGYGYKWWVLAGDLEGLYEARGRGGQAIMVWPDKEVVAVFTGRGADVRNDVAPLLAEALQSDEALEPDEEAYARLTAAIEKAKEPPPAQLVPDLPPMAATVSGKVYRLEPNQFDVQCISLLFASPADVMFTLTVGEGSFDLPVGMDGVPRFSETGPTGIPVGVTGEWTAPIVFEMAYSEVAGLNHLQIRGDFAPDGEGVTLLFTDPAGGFPTQIIPGSAAPKCD